MPRKTKATTYRRQWVSACSSRSPHKAGRVVGVPAQRAGLLSRPTEFSIGLGAPRAGFFKGAFRKKERFINAFEIARARNGDCDNAAGRSLAVWWRSVHRSPKGEVEPKQSLSEYTADRFVAGIRELMYRISLQFRIGRHLSSFDAFARVTMVILRSSCWIEVQIVRSGKLLPISLFVLPAFFAPAVVDYRSEIR